MELSEFSPYYQLFTKIIDSNAYINVEVLTDIDDDKAVSDSVLIKDVYYGDGNLLVKYFSQNFQIILVVPHLYFKTLESHPIEDFLAEGSIEEMLTPLENSEKSQKASENKTLDWDSKFSLNSQIARIAPIANKSQNSLYYGEVNVAVEGKFVFTVTALTNRLKQMIVKNFYSIWVKGEVSDAKISVNGHLFFNLRDENTTLSCVIYSRQAKKLKFKVETGIVFECLGNLTVYEKRGVYQLVVERLTPEGQGDLDFAYKQLQAKLGKEGLFAMEKKKPIPRYPMKIGVITSSKGAALHDFLETTLNEFPHLNIVVLPCLVQGEKAAESIAKMIEYANLEKELNLEVLVLTRGGGSNEDLWCFNEEVTARAIFASEIPIISAVGHEVDWPISDLVADYRSATPTAAAQFICQGMKNLEQEVFLLSQSLQRNLKLLLEAVEYRTKTLSPLRFFNLIHTMIDLRQKEVTDLNRRLFFAIRQILSENTHMMSIIKVRLNSLSPRNVFKRGYMIVKKDNCLVTDLDSLEPNDKVEIVSYSKSLPAQILDG